MPNSFEYGKRLIQEFYEMEEGKEFHDAQHQSVSFKVSVDTASLLTVIAERFGQSRHGLGGEILDDMALSMFAALNESDRLELGRKADDLTTDYMLKKGFTNERHGITGQQENRFGKWEMLAAYNQESDKPEDDA